MKPLILYFTFFLLIRLTFPLTVTAQVVDIPDPNLRAAIETALGKASGATITTSDMARLTHLEARNANISDLTGLEHATNLRELLLKREYVQEVGRWINSSSVSDLSPLVGLTNLTVLRLEDTSITDISPVTGLTNLTRLWLGGNAIADISPVARLTNLTGLSLWDNNITDISALAGLTNLTRLELGGNDIADISPLAGLTNLTGLWIGSNNITDILPLAGLTNLTRLELGGNDIADISALAGLTKLARTDFRHNYIRDISPLVVNTGLGSGDEVLLNDNPLSSVSIKTHVPALQSRGVTVEFDNRPAPPLPSIDTNGMVRLVYFLPSDRPARPDIVAALRQLIKDAQQFFADEMERHGYGRQTFTVETDESGEPVVHHIDGKFTEEYYYITDPRGTDFKIWQEFFEHFNGSDLQHVYLTAIDLSYETLNEGRACGLAGVTFFPSGGRPLSFFSAGAMRHRDLTKGEEALGGSAIIPASGNCVWGATLHELGHTFGLDHDYREGRKHDVVGSKCAAEWLAVSRFFNTKSIFRNAPGEIQLLSLQTYSRDVISLRFEVTDPNGLHQAQLLVPELAEEGSGWAPYRLFDCKRLNGTTDTVESVVSTAELVDRITLQIIDVGGNITWATFPIELDALSPAKNALDVNGDGIVDIWDLIPLASRFGQRGKDPADVNEDGVVDIVDLLLVTVPISSLPRRAVEMFASSDVQQWLTDAKQLDVENETLEKGIFFLEHLLAEIDLLSQPMEAATNPLKAIFVGHTDPIWSVAFSPDGQTLASASWDKTIRLWAVDTEQLLYTLIGHTYHVNSVAFSPDGQTLASASSDGTVRLWNPNTGAHKRTLADHSGGVGVTSVAFSSDGTMLASGGGDRTVRLWNTTTWQVERTLTGLVDSVVFSPDGTMLASGGRDNTIRLWNPHTGAQIRTLNAMSPINRLAFSPDGGTLVSGGWDNTIRLWDPHTGQLKRTLPNQGGWVNPVAFSPDEGTLVIGERGISLWDIETGQYKEPLAEDIGDAVSVVFSPDGTMLASGSADNLVRLWDFTPFLITPGLSKISGDNQTGVAGVILANPFVIVVRDKSLSVLEGISVAFTVTGGDGTLNVTHAITDKNGRAESTLTLGPNQGTNAVSVSAVGMEGSVIFTAVAEAAINIPDPNLHAAIETALGKASGATITPSEMTKLTHLTARNADISDLTGLEYATNLKSLRLGGEQVGNRFVNSSSVSDLSPLVGLIHLEDLDLWSNLVSDLSPLAGLTNLKHLGFVSNNISDISVLAGLTNLGSLFLDGNPISDLSPLAGLTQLTKLGIDSISVSDFSPLAALTSLKWMRLAWNNISDLSPLVANTGLESGDEINLKGNPLSYQSIHTHIPTLQSRGVTVEFDNRAHPALLKISGDNQNGASLTPLSQPFVIEAQDANGSVLAGISVRFTVTTGGGTLNTTITRTDTNGRAQSTLTLGPNLGTNTVEVSAAEIEVPATFHAISETESPPISADVNGDGSVNVLDLIVITANLDNRGSNLAADVNRDGVVNILDLVLAAGMFDGAAAAPSTQPQVPKTLTAVEVQGWLTEARSLEVRNPIIKRGIIALEQLLVYLTPKETELLANYPNPFNPETWIPYRLAEDAFVTLTIYDGSGLVVRTLDVGHQIASAYESRSKAIYWDGRNDVGEGVASDVYFYTLTAGNYSATRRMLIIK